MVDKFNLFGVQEEEVDKKYTTKIIIERHTEEYFIHTNVENVVGIV